MSLVTECVIGATSKMMEEIYENFKGKKFAKQKDCNRKNFKARVNLKHKQRNRS